MNSHKRILLVEDSDRDAELIIMALEKIGPLVKIERAQDGVEAFEILGGRNGFAQNITLVLLDIKLPRMNGLETLERLKKSETLRLIPVVMLTSSREDTDVIESYRLGANAYVVKPVEFRDLQEAVNLTGRFWCQVNEVSP